MPNGGMVMSANTDFKRLPYKTSQIFLLGGFAGSALNLSVSVFLYRLLHLNPYLSFFGGTLCNEIFHHLYYHVIFENKEIRLKTSLVVQFLLYGLVAVGSLVILWFFMEYLSLGFIMAVILSLVCLACLNILFVRISSFSSAELADVFYADIEENYYDTLTNKEKVSGFRAWYHSSRFEKLTRFVADHYQPGMKIADLGCGGCSWNINGLPVTGVDVNENMLRWACRKNRLKDYRVTDNLAETSLPSKNYDIVVMSETLEHLFNLEEVLTEVQRILKDNGTFLITVPYDFFLGPFFLLFNLNCIYMGYLRGSLYHRYRCGHINHFTQRRLQNTLRENGFLPEGMFIVNGLLIYATAKKRHD